MDVNTVHSSQAPSAAVASPVVPASAPDLKTEHSSKQEVTVREPIRTDTVELSKESQVAAATKDLIVEHNQNSPRGSRAYHDETVNRFVIEVVNSDSEVIRQIPMEDALESARRFQKLTGEMFNLEA